MYIYVYIYIADICLYIADFSRRTLFGHNYAYGVRIKAQLSGQLFAFILELFTAH